MKSIIEKVLTLASYSLFLPENTREEFANELDRLKKEIPVQPELLPQKLEALITYSYFLPDFTKPDFIVDLNKIKDEFKKYNEKILPADNGKNGEKPPIPASLKPDNGSHASGKIKGTVISEPSEPVNAPIAKIAAPAAPTEKKEYEKTAATLPDASTVINNIKNKAVLEMPVTKDTMPIVFSDDVKAPEIHEEEDLKKVFIKPAGEKTERTLFSVTKLLIPKITKKGRNMAENPSTPVNQLKLLKLINDRSSIADLYNMYSYNYENFLEFLNFLYVLEINQYVTFIKIKNIRYDEAWVKIGQVLLECNIIHEINVKNAYNYMKLNKGMKIGEAMTELRFVPEDALNNAFKVQKWISDVIEHSVFVDGIEITGTAITNASSAINIMYFIIPAFKPEIAEKFAKVENKNISALLKVIDSETSLLEIFENNKESFKSNKEDYFKIIAKLDKQGFLTYKRNEKISEREASIRFGELAIALDYISEKQVEETFIYRHKNPDKKLLIGETLVEMGAISREQLEICLQLQKWINGVLIQISYESAFSTAVKAVLDDYFKLQVSTGKFVRKAFEKPLRNIICINYTFTGTLKGEVYYIFDTNFAEKLSKILMQSYGMDAREIDKSIISELCNMITGNTLTKLDKLGVFCETDLPRITMDESVVIADHRPISILPLTNQFGRFIIGFKLD